MLPASVVEFTVLLQTRGKGAFTTEFSFKTIQYLVFADKFMPLDVVL